MKKSFLFILSIAAAGFMYPLSASAQRSNYGADSLQKNNAKAQKQPVADTTLPIKYIDDKNNLPQGRLSLRNDFPYNQAPYQQSKALAYPDVRQEDISYSIRVWEDIDTRKPVNRSLMYALNDYGSQQLISVILKAIKSNQLTAFSADDDRFTTPLTPAQAADALGNGLDTSATYDLDGNINGYQVRSKAIDLDSIYTYRLKEDWFYDKSYGKMMVRIIGIAPVTTYTLSNGEIIPNSEHALFWIYFSDLRSILTQYNAYNTKAPGTQIPFQELFDLRQFKGEIVKSNYENPGEISWNKLYPDLGEQQKEAAKIRSLIKNYGNAQYEIISEDTPENTSKKRRNR